MKVELPDLLKGAGWLQIHKGLAWYLTGSELKLYEGLLTRYNRKSKLCCPSTFMIAKDLNLSNSTVLRIRQALVKYGLITIETRKGRGGRYFYRFPLLEASKPDCESIIANLIRCHQWHQSKVSPVLPLRCHQCYHLGVTSATSLEEKKPSEEATGQASSGQAQRGNKKKEQEEETTTRDDVVVVKNLVSQRQIKRTISRIQNFGLAKQFSELAEVTPGHLLLGWLDKIASSGKEILNPEAYLSSVLREGYRPEVNFDDLVKAYIPAPHLDEFDQHFRKEFWPIMKETGKNAGFLLSRKMLDMRGWNFGKKRQKELEGEAFRELMAKVDRKEAIYKTDPESVLDSVFAYIWPLMKEEL